LFSFVRDKKPTVIFLKGDLSAVGLIFFNGMFIFHQLLNVFCAIWSNPRQSDSLRLAAFAFVMHQPCSYIEATIHDSTWARILILAEVDFCLFSLVLSSRVLMRTSSPGSKPE